MKEDTGIAEPEVATMSGMESKFPGNKFDVLNKIENNRAGPSRLSQVVPHQPP